ncbi:DUF3574 domain-containing protein [Thalassobaculum sp.]|uniref:DUF3574 domain-containing protein n=1 Tax=Thalassobaculum sp. TaxID=2022740 RepID=UPI0032EF7A8B
MRVLLVLAVLLLAVPASAAECAGEAWIESTLYMGRGKPDGGGVGDAQVQAFVREVIVPAFPDGFTLYDARGHWRDGPTGRPVDETTLVFVVVHPPGPAADAAVRTIAETYAGRFDQTAVLGSSRPACVTFYGPKK